MKVDYERSLRKAWDFANDGRRFTIYSLYIVAMGLMFFAAFLSILNKGIMLSGVEFIAAFLVTLLLGVFIDATLIHNFTKPKSLKQSARVVASRYSTLLAVVIFILVLNWVAGIISISPMGVLLSLIAQIIIALVFFYAYQEVVLSKRNFSKTVNSCWSLFTKHWIHLIITGVIITIVSGLIILVSAIPLILLFVMVAYNAAGFSMSMIYSNAAMVFVSALSLIFGITLSKLLTIGIMTDTYTQIKKK